MLEYLFDYIQFYFEKDYYEQNLNMLTLTESCLQSEDLWCNCVTGLMINYGLYAAMLAFDIDIKGAEISVCKENSQGKTVICLSVFSQKETENPRQSTEKEKCVDVFKETESSFLFGNRVCQKSKEEQIHFKFRHYGSREVMNMKEEEVTREFCLLPAFQNSYVWFCFWLMFLSALRTTEVVKASESLLLLALYSDVSQVSKKLYDFSKENTGNAEVLNIIERIFLKYIAVLEDIDMEECNPKISRRFSQAFRKQTGLAVEEFIEQIYSRSRKPLLETELFYAYQRGIISCKKTYYINYIRKTVELLSEDSELKRKIQDSKLFSGE